MGNWVKLPINLFDKGVGFDVVLVSDLFPAFRRHVDYLRLSP